MKTSTNRQPFARWAHLEPVWVDDYYVTRNGKQVLIRGHLRKPSRTEQQIIKKYGCLRVVK